MTSLLVGFIELLKGWVMNLPELGIDSSHLSSIQSAVSAVLDFIVKANFLVPIDTILLLISIKYGFRLIKFTIFIVNWVIRRIADIIP